MNNFSPGMKALMLPRKEPLVAKTLRRGGSVDSRIDHRRVAPIRQTVYTDEDRLDDLKKNSLTDLPPVGRSSALDDYYGE